MEIVVINPIQKKLNVEYKNNCNKISEYQNLLKNKFFNYEQKLILKSQIKTLAARNKRIKGEIRISQMYFNTKSMIKIVNNFKKAQNKVIKAQKEAKKEYEESFEFSCLK